MGIRVREQAERRSPAVLRKIETGFLTRRDELLVLLLPHATSGVESNGRGEMPTGSLDRPKVSMEPCEQLERCWRRTYCVGEERRSLTIRLIALVSQKTRSK